MTEEFENLPLHRTWLDDIVEILMHRPNGQAEVEAIANDMMRTDRDVGATPCETITRTINNYCRDANDASREVKYDLFERVARATYRLRSWPDRPDLIEIQGVKFDDDAHQSTWEFFLTQIQKDDLEKVKSMSRRELLQAFKRNIRPGAPLHDELEHRKNFYSQTNTLFAKELQVGRPTTPHQPFGTSDS